MDWFVRNWDLLIQFGFVAYGGLFALLFLLEQLEPAYRANRWLLIFAGIECLSRGIFLSSALLGMTPVLTHAGILVSAVGLLSLGAVGQYRLWKSWPLVSVTLLLGSGAVVGVAALTGVPSVWVAALLTIGLLASAGAALALCHYGPFPENKTLQPKAAGALIGLLGFAEVLSLVHPWAAIHEPNAGSDWMPVTAAGLVAGLSILSVLLFVYRVKVVAVRDVALGAVQGKKAIAWDALIGLVLAAGLALSAYMAREAGEYELDFSRANARSVVSLAAASFASGGQSGEFSAEPGALKPASAVPETDILSMAVARKRLEYLVEGSGRYLCAFLVKRVEGEPKVVLAYPSSAANCNVELKQTALSRTAHSKELFGSSAAFSLMTGPIWDSTSALTGIAAVPGRHSSQEELWVGLDISGRRTLVRVFGARAVPLAGAAMVCILILFMWAAALANFAQEAKSRKAERQRLEERAAAEEAIRASEARFRAMGDSARDAIITMDGKGRVTFWNPAAEQLFGYEAHEVLGVPLHSFLAPTELQPIISTRMQRFQEDGTGPVIGRTQEVTATCKDGRFLTVELSLSSMKVGSQWHAVGVARDVSDRKRQEAELSESKRKLEAANQQLSVAADEAKVLAQQASAANVAKSEFLANMSHEFRTPLNGIMGAASLLAETGLTADQRDYIGIVRRSAENLLGILNDILDISKIESGKLGIEEIDFDPHALIEDVVELTALRAQEKGLDVSCHTEPYVPDRVRGDPARLRQILVNLVGNAVKFTPRGEIAVRASAVDVSPGSMVLRIDVRDTGIGIPKDKLGSLFQPFSQVDASDTRSYGGTGLGLSICKRLLEQMGGRIEVESTAGKGSVFRFWLPLKIPAATPRVTAPWKDLSNLRVLVLDDHDTSRRVLGALLEQWGCIHQEESQLEEALICMREANDSFLPYDVAIIDASSDFGSAERVANWVRDQGYGSKTRLVLMTALGRRGDVGRLKQLGFSAYVTKPVKRGQLHEILNLVAHGSFTLGQTDLVTRYTVQEIGRQRLRVLVVDDGEVNRQVASSMLESLGWRAEAVEDAEQALKSLAKERYELVLMDIQMPGMDGRTATRIIREGRQGVKDPMVPIVAVTASAGHEEEQACLAAGMDEYLTKPLEMRRLAKVLSRWHEVLRTESADRADFEDTAELTPSGGPPTFDRSALLERLGGDESAVDSIVALFTKTAPATLDKIAAAMQEGNLTAVSRLAHQLKGSAGNCGAMAMHKVSHHVEKWAAQNDGERASKAFERLREQFEAFQSETSQA